MPRTTAELVEGICEVDEEIDLTPFIYTANSLVTRLLGTSVLDSDALEIIERWLSAHFYHILDLPVANESVGKIKTGFQFKVGLYLTCTEYGQMAILLDTTGTLAKYNQQMIDGKRFVRGLVWLGTDYCTDVEDECNV